MSFCILTLTKSAGTPTNPPNAPEMDAIPIFVMNETGSPLVETICLET